MVRVAQGRDDRAAAGSASAYSKILEAAAKLFEQQGFPDTTVRQIAEAVGIKSASIFYHFTSKEELLFRIVEHTITDMLARQMDAIAAVNENREKLRALIKTELDAFVLSYPGQSAEVVIHEWRHLDQERRASLLKLRARYERIWNRVLDACFEEGLIRADPRVTRRLLNGAFAWTKRWFREGRRVSPHRLGEEVLLLITQQSPSTDSDRKGN